MALKGITLSSSLTIFATLLLLSTAVAATRKAAAGTSIWEVTMTNVITSALDNAKARQTMAYDVVSKLPRNLEPQTKDSIESTCKEAFDTLIANMEKCLEYVKNDPTSSLKYSLSSLSFFDCQNELEEFGISVPDVKEFNDELAGTITNLVAVLDKNSAYVK